MPETTRILLVDDYPLIAVGLRATFAATPDMRLIGFADCAATVPALCERLDPHLLVYSWKTNQSIPLEQIPRWRAQFPSLKLLLMVAEEQQDQVKEAIALGVHGIILKSDPLPLIENAVRSILTGGTWFSPSLSLFKVQSPRRDVNLNDREKEILNLVARGWDNPTIAAELYLSEQTVRNYSSRIYDKLKVVGRGEAIVWALTNGYGRNSE